MRYWWVNQNQTYRHEIAGGYLWSPKVNRNGARNPFYDFMREVAPGDAVFSYFDGYVSAIGFAQSYAYESPKPLEFGSTGAHWDKIGWRVDVAFTRLPIRLRPADVMDVLAPLLPGRYAPLRSNGGGLQNVYLALLPDDFARSLVDLIGPTAQAIMDGRVLDSATLTSPAVGLDEWEDHQQQVLQTDSTIIDTEKAAIVQARRGQGLFKSRVLALEKRCRITGVARLEHLRASHCKPWRDATNEERLDGENGLLLTPTIDHLFDRGFIGFERNGDLLISPVAHQASLERMGIEVTKRVNVGTFSEGQKAYLDFHRESVLLKSKFI